MAILTEVWAKDIAENLFPDNSFMGQSRDSSMWVKNDKIHRPQAGSPPEVVRNRSTVPATAVKRTDSDNAYELDEFTSTPTVIEDIEEIETSYNKRQSVLYNHISELNRKIANWMAYYWAAEGSSNILRTNGDNRAANVPGATGTRKMILIEDIIKAKALLDDMDIPADGRNILFPAHMYNDLLEKQWKDLVSLDKTGKARLSNGQILTLFGFNIWIRGKNIILSYTNAATPVVRQPDASALTTANAAALLWHKDFTERAKGTIKVYADEDKPEYYGSIFSTMARAGGQKYYTDGRGVIAIVEQAGS